jgi:ApbE superfamily uncharacterized protein (UPF0280 family)
MAHALIIGKPQTRPLAPLAAPDDRLRRASGGSIFEKSKPAGAGAGGAIAALLPDGRLHLQHGPIDIVAEAFGAAAAVRLAYARAAGRFASVLDELVAELPALRLAGCALTGEPLRGAIAGQMAAAVAPFRPAFITPMAAVAGAVADAVLAAMVGPEFEAGPEFETGPEFEGQAEPGITRAYVNNGGDIALWLAPGQSLTAAVAKGGGIDRVTVRAGDAVRGIATSGWRGRSHSFGVADAVTVLARSAAMADAAATMIANAVDVDHPGILRRPATELRADSDLGARLVTVHVPALGPEDRAQALRAGLRLAETLAARGLIEGAALFLQGDRQITGAVAAPGQKEMAVG